MSCISTMMPRNFFQGPGNPPELASDANAAALYGRAAANALAQPQWSSLAAAAAAPSTSSLIESVMAQERAQALLASQLSTLNTSSATTDIEALLLRRERENLLSNYSGLADLDQSLLSRVGSALPRASVGASVAGGLPTALGVGLGLSNPLARGLLPTQPIPSTPQSLLVGQPQRGVRDSAPLIPDHLAPLLDGSERTGRKGRTGTFPQKLHLMLSELEKEEGGREIASFLHHGRAFAIHKPKEFVNKIMPKYFRMSRFSSFQRQLNLYEFQRITEGPDKGAYYHELFLQGHPMLCQQIKRNKIKGANGKPQSQHFPLGPGIGAFQLDTTNTLPSQATSLSVARLHALSGQQGGNSAERGS